MLFLKISSKNKNPIKNSMIILLHYLFFMLFSNSAFAENNTNNESLIRFEKNTDVRFESPISHEVLDGHFSGVLQGTGKTFLEVQEYYNISATFLAGIAILESGNGTSKLARCKNNVFGLKGKSFNSVEECIWYVGNLFANSSFYFKRGHTTIERIQQVYAPNHNKKNRKWVKDVISIANKLEKSYN